MMSCVPISASGVKKRAIVAAINADRRKNLGNLASSLTSFSEFCSVHTMGSILPFSRAWQIKGTYSHFQITRYTINMAPMVEISDRLSKTAGRQLHALALLQAGMTQRNVEKETKLSQAAISSCVKKARERGWDPAKKEPLSLDLVLDLEKGGRPKKAMPGPKPRVVSFTPNQPEGSGTTVDTSNGNPNTPT